MDNMLRMQPHPGDAAHKIDNYQIGFSVNHLGALWLRYHVDCPPDLLDLADLEDDVVRGERLWEATCFEAFVREAGRTDYLEFNFSSGRKWAAYHFQAYREGMQDQQLRATPEIWLDVSESHFALEATVQLPPHLIDKPIDLGIASILFERGGAKSYWSLVHPAGAPDFHNEQCFALKLASPLEPLCLE